MSENDKKERLIGGGETSEADDQEALMGVRSELLEHVRIRKGLPPDPVQLDVTAVSQLSAVPTIDYKEERVTTKIVDISSLSPIHSIVGLSIRQKRLGDIEEEKAA